MAWAVQVPPKEVRRMFELDAALRTHRLVPVLRGADPTDVAEAAVALDDAGLPIVELTMTVPDPLRALELVVGRRPQMLVGMGSVRSPEEARRAADAGAHFLVTPGTTTALLESLASIGTPAVPGVGTVSEVMRAHAAGFPTVKLFPARHHGPSWLADLRGPFPDAQVVPTGGIEPADVGRWITAGALAVGLGSSLCSAREIADHDWGAVHEHLEVARRALTEVPEGR